MSTPTESPSLESINNHLPLALREAPIPARIDYVRRKKNQFKLLFWVGLFMAAFITLLLISTFFMPNIDPMDNLVMSIIIIVIFAGASVGNRSMARRYGAFEARLLQEPQDNG